jgi:hypothetical protein
MTRTPESREIRDGVGDLAWAESESNTKRRRKTLPRGPGVAVSVEGAPPVSETREGGRKLRPRD